MSWSLSDSRGYMTWNEVCRLVFDFLNILMRMAVHAPHGIYQQIEGNNEAGTTQSTMSYVTNGIYEAD